jgi:hypothetical protein
MENIGWLVVGHEITSDVVCFLTAKKLPKNEQAGPAQTRQRGVDLNQEAQPQSTGCCKW